MMGRSVVRPDHQQEIISDLDAELAKVRKTTEKGSPVDCRAAAFRHWLGGQRCNALHHIERLDQPAAFEARLVAIAAFCEERGGWMRREDPDGMSMFGLACAKRINAAKAADLAKRNPAKAARIEAAKAERIAKYAAACEPLH